MRRLLHSFLLLFVSSVLFAACKSSQPQISSSSPRPSASPQPKQEEKVQVSKNFTFSWDSQTKQATVKKDNQQLYQFILTEKPIAAVIHKAKQYLAIVTVKNNIEEDPQDLFIYTGLGKPLLVYEGKKVDISSEEADPIYSEENFFYPYESDAYTSQFSDQREIVNFSPDGKYLFATVLGYEGTIDLVINTSTGKIMSQNGINPAIFWSPNQKCVASSERGIGYDPREGILVYDLPRNKNAFITLGDWGEAPEKPTTGIDSVQWKDGCNGEVVFRFEDQSTGKYSFTFTQERLQKVTEPAQGVLDKSVETEQENVFYTVFKGY
jgi:hypothetical protein